MTTSVRPKDIKKAWWVIDAKDQILGRLSTQVANLLRGKHKTQYTPHMDCGDHVIVVNADKVKLSGNKMQEKIYIRHTGYPGGQRKISAEKLVGKKPIALVETSVKGMLPKNKLGRAIYKNLHVYAEATHPHEAQEPKTISLEAKN